MKMQGTGSDAQPNSDPFDGDEPQREFQPAAKAAREGSAVARHLSSLIRHFPSPATAQPGIQQIWCLQKCRNGSSVSRCLLPLPITIK